MTPSSPADVAVMPLLARAQFAANVWSLLAYGLLAIIVVRPWLKRQERAVALRALVAPHLFRYVALLLFSARQAGYPISEVAAAEAVVGDLAGAALAWLAFATLNRWPRLGTVLCWILVVETLADFAVGIRRKALEPLWGAAEGATWVLLNFYVTLVMAVLPLLAWQLWTRRRVTAIS